MAHRTVGMTSQPPFHSDLHRLTDSDRRCREMHNFLVIDSMDNALQVHSNTADSQYGQFFGNYNRHSRFDLDVIF